MANASLSNYPTSVDSFDRISDLDENTLKKSNQYKKLVNAGNYAGAKAYLNNEENADLKRCAINAEIVNKHSDAIVNIEKQVNENYSSTNNLIKNDYLSKTDASNTYLTLGNASSTYLTKTDAINTYLTKSDAAGTYLSKNNASDIYLTQRDARNIYAEKSHIHNEFYTNMFDWGKFYDVFVAEFDGRYGVTGTCNYDGTFVVNGTSTKYIHIEKSINTICRKDAILLGVPSKDCGIRIGVYINGSDTHTANTFESERIWLPSGTIISKISIYMPANSTVNNVTLKPMITYNINATYNDFIPFTGTTGNINSDIGELRSELIAIKKILEDNNIV